MTRVEYADLRGFLSGVEDSGELKTIRGVTGTRTWAASRRSFTGRGRKRRRPYSSTASPAFRKGTAASTACSPRPSASPSSLGLSCPAEEGRPDGAASVLQGQDEGDDAGGAPLRGDGTGHGERNGGGQMSISSAFPVPLHHELDGGRYIGTADAVITRDPEEGWVNSAPTGCSWSTRIPASATSPRESRAGSSGTSIWTRASPVRSSSSSGSTPSSISRPAYQVPWGVSELDYAGGLMGEPMEVIEGKVYGPPHSRPGGDRPGRARCSRRGSRRAPSASGTATTRGERRRSRCSR